MKVWRGKIDDPAIFMAMNLLYIKNPQQAISRILYRLAAVDRNLSNALGSLVIPASHRFDDDATHPACTRGGLDKPSVAKRPVRSYHTISPLPFNKLRAVYFCSTFPNLAVGLISHQTLPLYGVRTFLPPKRNLL